MAFEISFGRDRKHDVLFIFYLCFDYFNELLDLKIKWTAGMRCSRIVGVSNSDRSTFLYIYT